MFATAWSIRQVEIRIDCASPLILSASPLIAVASLLMALAVLRMAAAVPLMAWAVPLMAFAVPLTDTANPSIDLAVAMIVFSLATSDWLPSGALPPAVFRIELAMSFVCVSWVITEVSPLMLVAPDWIVEALALIRSATETVLNRR